MMLNPVFRREIRSVLRSWKPFAVITVFVLFLTFVLGVSLYLLMTNSYNGFNPGSAMVLYVVLSGFQLGLILLMVPALTGGAISGERERQTLDLMMITKMSAFSVVFGKLLSSLLYVLLLLISTMPVCAVIFYFGGVSLPNLLTTMLFIISVAMMAGSVSLFLSALIRKTIPAIVLSYLFIIVITIGILVMVAFSEVIYRVSDLSYLPGAPIYFLMAANPFMGYASIMDAQLGYTVINSMMSFTGNHGGSMSPWMLQVPLWVYSVAFNAVVTLLALAFAAFLVTPVRHSRRYR